MSSRHGTEIAVQGARKTFGSVTALERTSFTVQPGEFLVLLGPSGSGKSTLVRALAGIERLDHGSIHLSGQLVSSQGCHVPPEKRDLAMVFQDYALWPHLSVRDNVAFALRRRRVARAERQRRVEAALHRVGLHAHSARYPSELSGGEQQRVALARAVVAEPGLLLFDEPLSNLDADLRERLRVQIATLTRDCGATAVYITHDQSEAFALADRIGVLDHGRLVQLATPEELYRCPRTPFVARFTGTAGELEGTVVHHDPATDTLRLAIGQDRVVGRAIAPVAAGEHVTVLVRPAATYLLDDEPASTRTTQTGAHPYRLTGTVLDIAYRGRGYDHLVQCAAGTLGGIHAPRPRQRGEQVQVCLDPDGVLAYPKNDRDGEDLTTVILDKTGDRMLADASTRESR